METKNVKLGFRVLPSDRRALRAIAQVEGESMAVVIRKLIRHRARELGVLDLDLPKTDPRDTELMQHNQ